MATLLILLPIIAATLGFIGKTRKISAVLMFIDMLVAIFLYQQLDNSGVMILDFGTFTENIRYTLRLDYVSMPITAMVTIVAAIASIYVFSYNQNPVIQNRFLRINALFTSFLIYFICSDNMLALCTGYGMTVVVAFFMLSFYDEKNNLGNIAVHVTSMNFISFAILLVLSALLFNKTGSYNFDIILPALKTDKGQSYIYLIAVTAFIMSGTFGLHTFLTKACKTSQMAIISLYSSGFISAGLFLFCRFHMIFDNNKNITDFILLYCSLSSIILSFEAILQTDIKKTEILSICAQISLVFLTFACNDIRTFIDLIIYHGFAETVAVMIIGAIIVITMNEKDMLQMGGIRSIAKTAFLSALISFIFILSLPILLSQIPAIKNTTFLLLTLSINSFLTAFYLAKMIILVFLKQFRGDENIFARINDTPKTITFCIAVMILFTIYSMKKFLGVLSIDYTILYGIISSFAGIYLSYRFNYRHIPSKKYEKVINENRNIAIIRLLGNAFLYKPASFCYKIIDGKIVPFGNRAIISTTLLMSQKLKKAKESSLFVYNIWIIICMIMIIIYAYTRNKT